MDEDSNQLDMGEYFDFGEASTPAVIEFPPASAPPGPRGYCPSHPGEDGCLCHGFMDDVCLDHELAGISNCESQAEVPVPILGPTSTQEFNNDFSSWLPRYKKPEQACDYCRDRQLDCFTLYEGQTTCSPCNALFRHCSFSKTSADLQRPKGSLDTLHLVPEDVCQERGAFTGLKSLKSFLTGLDESERTAKKSGTRFSRAAVKVLKDWIEEHRDHPYPTDEEKDMLKNKTGLKGSQISNWLANARRRGKVRPRGVPSPIPLSPAGPVPIDIPGASQKTWDAMNPLERWEHSPPENEPASVTDIANAVASTQYDRPSGTSSEDELRRQHDSSNGSSFSLFKAPSSTSFGTRQSSGSAGSFDSAAWSHGSRNSFSSLGSLAKKDRRRRRRPAPGPTRSESDQNKRVFQCTFCTDTFRSKYDWTRHEKSLHINLEKWICAPIGPVTVCSSSGQKKCVFCGEVDPSKEHIEGHNHRACEEKGFDARVFYRKDHLRQHLRLMHDCKMIDTMESWKCAMTYVKSRCGFCGEEFTRWQERVDHLSQHFRNGALMKDWRGCRGLDAEVAALVTNAMPPYLIGNEAKSPNPFSATNEASMRPLTYATADLEALIPMRDEWSAAQASQGGLEIPFRTLQHPAITQDASQPSDVSRLATCWEVLTVRLGKYVKEQMAQGVFLTDEMLQSESRRLLYGEYDSWNQTAADNPEWLALFKKAHGLDPAPVVDTGGNEAGRQYELVGEDMLELGFGNFLNLE